MKKRGARRDVSRDPQGILSQILITKEDKEKILNVLEDLNRRHIWGWRAVARKAKRESEPWGFNRPRNPVSEEARRLVNELNKRLHKATQDFIDEERLAQ